MRKSFYSASALSSGNLFFVRSAIELIGFKSITHINNNELLRAGSIRDHFDYGRMENFDPTTRAVSEKAFYSLNTMNGTIFTCII